MTYTGGYRVFNENGDGYSYMDTYQNKGQPLNEAPQVLDWWVANGGKAEYIGQDKQFYRIVPYSERRAIVEIRRNGKVELVGKGLKPTAV